MLILKFGLEIDLGVIQNCYAVLFEIFYFLIFQVGWRSKNPKIQNFVKMAKIWILTTWKISKNQNFKNCCMIFCITLKSICNPNFSLQVPWSIFHWSDLQVPWSIFTPRSSLRMGYCHQPTRPSVRTYVRQQIFWFQMIFLFFFGPSHQ